MEARSRMRTTRTSRLCARLWARTGRPAPRGVREVPTTSACASRQAEDDPDDACRLEDARDPLALGGGIARHGTDARLGQFANCRGDVEGTLLQRAGY